MAARIDSLLPGWSVTKHVGLARPEWLAMRKLDVTASELGCLFGDTRYLTPFGLYHRKLMGEDDAENEAMKRGRVMEPAAAKLLSMDLPELALESCEGNYLSLRTDDLLVRIGATKDYQGRGDMATLGPGLARLGVKVPASWSGEVSLAVELKAVAAGAYHTHWSAGPPRQYVLQAMTQAMLGGDDGAILAALVVSSAFQVELVVYCIPRDFDAELSIVERARDFWEGFEAQRIPEVQPADNRIIGDLFAARDGEVVDLSDEPEWHDIGEQRLQDKALSKALDTSVDGAEARLKLRMGTATKATLNGWTITWRQNSRARPLIWKKA